ncbi:nitric oxide reductase activation protein NorD [Pseudomonas saliphila]|uniref:nitric oxide reductase activation protein NorD n=1 Tax=Pseudomonas saliphila TaxID=2586906 RepID=UPI001238F4AA|nr:VWA domain-containing protein [Pseudomonas saliphila]
MAEAEDVITDAARHATIFTRNLWRRYRPPPPGPVLLTLNDVASRLDLLCTGVFANRFPIRVAQMGARSTLLTLVFRRDPAPRTRAAIPATDGVSIWLPRDAGTPDVTFGSAWYRVLALQQAMRVERGSAALIAPDMNPLLRDLYLLLEAFNADQALSQLLPGMRGALDVARQQALAARPELERFSAPRQQLELFLRQLLQSPCAEPPKALLCPTPDQSLQLAADMTAQFAPDDSSRRLMGLHPLYPDCWTGALLPTPVSQQHGLGPAADATDETEHDAPAPRSARLDRRPTIREAKDDEDDDSGPGPWMVHPEGGHEHAEDPMGLKRPVDLDDATSATEYGELVSELPEARLISTPGRPKEVLLTDDPPEERARRAAGRSDPRGKRIRYPEWDYQSSSYRDPGATVRLLDAGAGPQEWVDETLRKHRPMLNSIRRHFEMLRAEPVLLRRRQDGDDIDLDAYLENHADFRAGLPRSDALYQTRRAIRRNVAITLLIDVSGSTDGWVSGNRRIIDVEREAVLLVCMALESLGEPYAVQAFSGEGPGGVTVREIKGFDERYSNAIALRISALEPEHYTRAGAALRHATSGLMQQGAEHRLLILLSDGKPNDIDDYEGQYGVEDMRQAVNEASLQGIFPFCLTIDRQAAAYLPKVFGANRYALLPSPQRLPAVLLEWIRRLLV